MGDVGTKAKCFSERHQSTEDLTVIGHALPILKKPESPVIEPGVSNTRTIVVEPSATSDNSSKETSLVDGIKRPITGSESNTSWLSSCEAEEPKCNDDLEVVYVDEEFHRPVHLRPTKTLNGEVTSRFLSFLRYVLMWPLIT